MIVDIRALEVGIRVNRNSRLVVDENKFEVGD